MDSLVKMLDTSLGKAILGIVSSLLLGLGGLAGYFIRRRAEGASEKRDIDSLLRLADLRHKLTQQNVSLADLKAFRQEALGQTARVAVDTAQEYIERAQYLVELPVVGRAGEWPEAMTPSEMNQQAAAQFGEADDELTALLVERLATEDTDAAIALQRTHDAWKVWREEEAIWDARYWEGGTIRPLMFSTKMEQLTRERIASLRSQVGLEQDPSRVVVPYRIAPVDLAEHIEPGTTAAHVREILGSPHFISGSYWYYRFQEVRLDIYFDGEVVRDVSFLIIEGQAYHALLSGESLSFGTLTFGDLIALDDTVRLEFDWSARTNELIAKMRLGPSDAWDEYYFGAVIPFSGGGRLLNTDFHWDRESGRLLSPPSETLINWFGRTSAIDEHPRVSWFVK